jgi:hypothetical protein
VVHPDRRSHQRELWFERDKNTIQSFHSKRLFDLACGRRKRIHKLIFWLPFHRNPIWMKRSNQQPGNFRIWIRDQIADAARNGSSIVWTTSATTQRYEINVIPALFAARTSNVTALSQPALDPAVFC